MDWMAIDFEASCLPRHGRSFPIEVGICGPMGTFSWLIKPAPAWLDWDWTEEAFNLHGISRDQLDREGIAPATVVEQLLRLVGPARVFADSAIDSLWWATLFEAAYGPSGLFATPFRIECVDRLLDEIGARHDGIMVARGRADDLCPERHRAAADARWLHAVIEGLLGQVALEEVAFLSRSYPALAPACAPGGPPFMREPAWSPENVPLFR